MRIRNSILLFLFIAPAMAFAQPKNLVFEGAGIKGIAYGGVIQEMEKQGMMGKVKKVGGTSAGAITALLVSLGYKGEEITKIIYDTKFQKFNDGRYIFFGGISRTRKKYGWYRGKKYTRWIEGLIKQKTGNADITFAELHKAGYRDLYVTATNLSQQKLVVLSYENYPKMKVKDAMRITMSIPLYYQAVSIDSTGKIMTKAKDMRRLDVLVDGGIIGNFPIQIFDSTVIVNGVTTRYPNPKTLGIRIDTEEQIAYDIKRGGLAPSEIHNIRDYMEAFYVFVLENLNRSELTEEDWKRTLSVNSMGIGPKVKKLSKAQKEVLISSGRQSVKKYTGAK